LNLEITETGGQDTIKTLDAIDSRVEKMSATSRRAFQAMSAEQQTAYLKFVGGAEAAAQATATALTTTVVPAARRAATAVTEIETASLSLSHSAMIGFGELARGMGRIAETGQLSAFAMREMSGAAMRLGGALGTAGGLAGIAVLLTGVIVELFTKARREMEETRKKFEEEIGKMANAAKSSDLEQKLRDVEFGTPYETNAKGDTLFHRLSQYASGAFEGSLRDLEGQKAALERSLTNANQFQEHMLRKQIADLEARIKPLLDRRDSITKAIFNVADQPQDTHGLLPFITSAKKEKPLSDADRQKAIDFLFGAIDHNDLLAMGVQTMQRYGSGIPQIDHKGLIKAAKLVPTPDQDDANKTIQQWQKYAEQLGKGVATTIGDSIGAGLEAIFEKGGSLKAGFKALTGSLLEGFGEMFERAGEQALIGLAFIQRIVTAIAHMNPAIGIPAALGLIALGAALKGAGSRASSVSSGGGGGGGGYYGSAPLGGTIIVNPSGASAGSPIAGMSPRPQVNLYATIFGKNDTGAQRDLLDMIDIAKRRTT
jgi:hypothetical protein